MNLKSIFENLDAVIESVFNGIDTVTKDLGKIDKEFSQDVKKANSSRKIHEKQDKENIKKIFGSKKTNLF
jgi:hypothetical protein